MTSIEFARELDAFTIELSEFLKLQCPLYLPSAELDGIVKLVIAEINHINKTREEKKNVVETSPGE